MANPPTPRTRRQNIVALIVALVVLAVAVPLLVHAIHGGYEQGLQKGSPPSIGTK